MYEALTLNPFAFSMTCITPDTSESIPSLTGLNVTVCPSFFSAGIGSLNVEAHFLIWLGYLDHNCAFSRERAAALDRVVRSFESFNRQDGSVFDDNGLADVEPRNFLRDTPAKIDIILFGAR